MNTNISGKITSEKMTNNLLTENHDLISKKYKFWMSTKLSIPLPRPSASPESKSREHTINSLSYWTPVVAAGSAWNRMTLNLLEDKIKSQKQPLLVSGKQ